MLPAAGPAHKCWRCLLRTELPRFSSNVLKATRLRGLLKGLATVHHPDERVSGRTRSPDSPSSGSLTTEQTIPIRERLRQWETENPLPAQSLLRDEAGVGARKNSLTRAQTFDTLEAEIDMEAADNFQPLFEGDDLVDLRSSASDIQAGDMVELTADTLRIQLLAVCLGTFNGYQHFYTNTGKWFTSLGLSTLFVVKHFVDKNTVARVVQSLPSTSGTPELLNVLQELDAGPSREAGAELIRRMDGFQNQARLVYQSSAAKLDNAHQVLSGTERMLSLSEIAESLLHRSLKVKGKFSSAALYAVHMALMQNGAGFRPASKVSHTKSYLFTITSDSDMAILQKMDHHVRSFLRWNTALRRDRTDDDLERSSFGQFVLKARKAVDDSRVSRDWSPHGMLKPTHVRAAPILPGWTTDDLEIIKFLHMWAATQMFSAVSRYHSIAASILRALERYEDVEYLDESVGWTFLQEIGWIKPWEIQSRYRLGLPGLELERGGGVKGIDGQLKADPFAGRRKEFDLRCFCVDPESATDIDDGVSLEATEMPGEYWVHVHVADPASRVPPDSALAAQAAAQTQTTYLWGHFSRMFGGDVIRDCFSLANNKPCLTFSARVNNDAELLDFEITPAVVRNVTYVSPSVVAQTSGDGPGSPPRPEVVEDVFSVGNPTRSTSAPSRTMAEAKDLSRKDVEELGILSRLASKLHARRLAKGAIPCYLPRPEVEVSFDGVEVITTPDGFMRCNGDPSIRVFYGGSTGSILVASIMQLAGEVAARWCVARGVPIPFRVQPRAAENAQALREFADMNFPKLRRGEPLTNEEWRTFMSLSGGTDISSQPAPNFAMGIDCYTKATSPLRRYSDLLLHWQIEATLLEEERLGQRREGNKDDSFLPFPRAALDEEVFPLLRVRERHAKLLDRTQGNREWMLQALLRAWKFEENPDLPRTFRFTVSMVISKRLVKGTINWFELDALLEPSGMAGVEEDGKHIALGEVKVGDVYEVELSDVNVHSRQVIVRAHKRVLKVR